MTSSTTWICLALTASSYNEIIFKSPPNPKFLTTKIDMISLLKLSRTLNYPQTLMIFSIFGRKYDSTHDLSNYPKHGSHGNPWLLVIRHWYDSESNYVSTLNHMVFVWVMSWFWVNTWKAIWIMSWIDSNLRDTAWVMSWFQSRHLTNAQKRSTKCSEIPKKANEI